MSERAYEAYESSEKPLSKWTKTEIINTVLDYRDDFEYDELKKYSKDALKVFLTYSKSLIVRHAERPKSLKISKKELKNRSL